MYKYDKSINCLLLTFVCNAFKGFFRIIIGKDNEKLVLSAIATM